MGEIISFLPCWDLRQSTLLVYVVFLSKLGTRWRKPRVLGEVIKKSKLLKSSPCHGFLSCPSFDFFVCLVVFFFGLKPALVYKFNGRCEVDQGEP